MALQCALFEYTSEDEDIYKSSAIVFDKRWIILPAASLILNMISNSKKNIPEELENLQSSELFQTNYTDMISNNIRIITDITSQSRYKIENAKYVGIFSCKNIKESVDFPLACGDYSNNVYNIDNLLSLFIILDLKVELIFNFKHLQESISNYVKLSKSWKINRGTGICIESIPFGSKALFGSYSQGVISNTAGKNNCFLLTDASTAPGAEGAPIYALNNDRKMTKFPIGIVISSINSFKGEHTGLTLGALLPPLLNQLLPKKWSISDVVFSNKNAFHKLIDKSLVQVFCGNGWGSGILVDKRNGIFITNSHVVRNNTVDRVELKWKNNQFSCTVIYRTKDAEIYDIALLKCLPKYVEEMSQVKIATSPAVKGENVVAAGYPIFKSDGIIFPVLTKGNISLVDSCIIHTTCCILPGSSGGAILRRNGDLLGMIVCHTTLTTKNEFVVYPRINMAIPISVIYKPLMEYIKTKDISSLQSLESTNADVLKKWKLFRGKL